MNYDPEDVQGIDASCLHIVREWIAAWASWESTLRDIRNLPEVAR